MEHDFDLLMGLIKAKTGDNKTKVAQKIGVARETLSRAITANDAGTFKLIEKIYQNDLITPEMAAIKALADDYAEFKAIVKKAFGSDFEITSQTITDAEKNEVAKALRQKANLK